LDRAEIFDGWWGRTPYLGRGLIREGVDAILEFGFSTLGARRIEALTDDLNERSCRLCERLGMELEGILRYERVDPEGTPRNTRIYAKIRISIFWISRYPGIAVNHVPTMTDFCTKKARLGA
jgi:RimJ/RimL family protein N-acetyltransferase